ncbi:MAG: hypothetical protein K2K10_03290, partial [Acetatifactor sp.]|nr:hypothetical protein [Acetatifactor sp.]
MERQTDKKDSVQSEMMEKSCYIAAIPEDYQLNLSDFALFLSVMKVKEAYADVLSIIMDEPELELKEVKVEQVILNRS